MRSVQLALFLAASGLGGLAASCVSSPAEPAPPPTFTPFDDDFIGYKAWHTFPATAFTVVQGIHASGKRTLYINHVPPHGSTEFPLGTIIVKEIVADDPTLSRTFAMVKRGGNYNLEGAAQWEWFELKLGVDPPVHDWRGLGPTNGEYGGDRAACNTCHMTGKANDYVMSNDLQLTSF